MYFAGLRVSEVCSLSSKDLNRKSMTLRVRQGKGGRDRANLGVPAETFAVFERWASVRPSSRYFFSTLQGKRLSERYLHAMVGRYAFRAEVLKATRNGDKPINPHMLRHSYATRLVERGVAVHDVQAALGHSSLSTTAVYLHSSNEKLATRLRAALSEQSDEPNLEVLVARAVNERLRELAV